MAISAAHRTIKRQNRIVKQHPTQENTFFSERVVRWQIGKTKFTDWENRSGINDRRDIFCSPLIDQRIFGIFSTSRKNQYQSESKPNSIFHYTYGVGTSNALKSVIFDNKRAIKAASFVPSECETAPFFNSTPWNNLLT